MSLPMYAKQYEITLPADYDMQIIRDRVAAGGQLFDERDGLGLKAFLARYRGVNGSAINQYAPFYLWPDTAAMAHFLVGGAGFQNIVRDFGRPAVQHWVVVATFAGPARRTVVASRQLTPLPATDSDLTGSTLTTRIEQEIGSARELSQNAEVHTVVLGVDPTHWRLLRFVLWQDAVPVGEPATERFEVLHLSAPGLPALPNGRHW
jgi:hypothetical protein